VLFFFLKNKSKTATQIVYRVSVNNDNNQFIDQSFPVAYNYQKIMETIAMNRRLCEATYDITNGFIALLLENICPSLIPKYFIHLII
jgi:hypothetical protein